MAGGYAPGKEHMNTKPTPKQQRTAEAYATRILRKIANPFPGQREALVEGSLRRQMAKAAQ